MNYTYSEFPLLSPGGWLWKWHSDIWLNNPLLWGAALRSVGFSSIPGLFPLSAGNPPAPSGDNQHVHRRCHVSLGAQNPSWLRTLKADLLTIVSHGLTTGRLPPDWALFLWILESCSLFQWLLLQFPYPGDLAVVPPGGVMPGWAETEHVLYSWIQETCS